MSEEKTSLTAALWHLAEQERRASSEHATPEELTAYHEGTLPPPAEAKIRGHLAHCRLCSGLLLDLAGFADLAPPPGVPELTDAEVEEDWQALRRKLASGVAIGEDEDEEKEPEEESATVVPFRPVSAAEPKSPGQSPPWFAIAASLLAVLGLSLGLYERRELEKLREPQLVESVSLSLDRGSEEPSERISSQNGGLLSLEPDSDQDYSEYEAEIVADGKVVRSVKPGKSSSLLIPGGALKPGDYQVRLFGMTNGNRFAAGEFPLRVDAP